MKSNVIEYFKTDWQAALQLTANNFLRLFMVKICSMMGRIKLALIGVEGYKLLILGGSMHIERFPGSRIYIGDSCRFNSNSIFNQRGIGKCIIQTGCAGAEIVIGKNCGFSGVSIVADKSVRIGDNVR